MTDITEIPDIDVVDDSIIVEVQKHRLAILRGESNVSRNLLMLMDSLTNTALANKKIVTDAESTRDSNDIVLQLTKELITMKHNPFQIGESSDIKPPDLPNIIPVDGEMD